jgi:hypothetical protein
MLNLGKLLTMQIITTKIKAADHFPNISHPAIHPVRNSSTA